MTPPLLKATPVEDIESAGNIPGAFEFYKNNLNQIVGMCYCCPCGCGAVGALPFRPERSHSWKWDGNMEKPTLRPSVHHIVEYGDGKSRTHWHGFLTDGVWKSV